MSPRLPTTPKAPAALARSRCVSFALDEPSRLALGYLASQTQGAPLRVVLSKTLVMAAVLQGWQAVDLRGYLAPGTCAFCSRPLTPGERMYCSRSCKQLAYMQRKTGRKIQTRLHERERTLPLKTLAGPAQTIPQKVSVILDPNALAARAFLHGLAGGMGHSRVLQRVLVQAALAAGWQDVDIRGLFHPRLCTFCGRPIAEGLNRNARYCDHHCVQASYYERKAGRRTVSRRRGDRPHCGGCGVELPVGSTARRCPNCRPPSRPKRRPAKPKPVEVVPETRACPACGTSFEVRSTSRKIYCSARCKSRMKERRRSPRRRVARVERP